MIQAAQPNELHNPDAPKEDVILKVPGFSTPVNQFNKPQNTTTELPKIPLSQKESPEWVKQFFHWWHKIAMVLLIGHGLLGLWESIYFMAFEYTELNELLSAHQIDVVEVNGLISRVIITVITTFVNILFAIRLSKVKETTAHNIDLIVATFLIISTKLIQDLLVQLDLLNLFFTLTAR